jgi:cytosine/uracil/thiamine/allantoin permease
MTIIERVKWLIRELVKMMSDKASFFSQKRTQGWMAFLMFYAGQGVFFVTHVKEMDVYTLTVWSSPLLLVAGYAVKQTQDEKFRKRSNNTNES